MHITIFGGGTGASKILHGLKPFGHRLSAVINMVDNGGSTGRLREQLHVLPPGDIRQTLAALSNAPQEVRNAFAHRFQHGDLKGHVLGNILIAGLEASGMSFRSAVRQMEAFLQVKGSVHPVTAENVELEAEREDGTIVTGQVDVHNSDLSTLKELRLNPAAKANPDALNAIRKADVLIVAPGSFYSSISPVFLAKGVRNAVQNSTAPLIYIVNLVTKPGHTTGWSVADFTCAVEELCGRDVDHAIYQSPRLPDQTVKKALKGGHRAAPPKEPSKKYVPADIAAKPINRQTKSDTVERNTIVHDPKRTAEAIQNILSTL